jgi:hypothetical protein
MSIFDFRGTGKFIVIDFIRGGEYAFHKKGGID